jgi:glycosyltransferase involved in cell wall biosynthesis
MQGPLVSVIIPVFNSENYLKQSIDSVLRQTYSPIEIIAVNDGSTDGSEAILKTEFGDNKNVKIITTENEGQSAACNLGFAQSKGDYIKFLDSDDLISPNFIENQMRLLSGSDDVISSASWGRFYNNDLQTFKLNTESVWRDLKPIDWIVEALENGTNMMQCALWLIPRKILMKSGLWNEELSLNNDFDFIIRVLLASSEIRFSRESILYYRSGLPNSLSQRKSKSAWLSGITSNLLGTESILTFENSPRTRHACGKNLCYWLFHTYYVHRDLGKLVEKKINDQNFHVVYGARPITKMFSLLFGWKLMLWIKYKLRLSP